MAHPVFESIDMQQLHTASFDAAMEKHQHELVGVFFWGHDCPNCEVAKKMFHQDSDLVKTLNIRWFHVNVYEDMELGTRFGLHGIPAFFFFKDGKRLGKISPFPGMSPFMSALQELRLKHP